MAKFDIWGKDPMPSFFAVRPMTNAQFIRVKLAAVALSTLATWAIMLGMVVFWAVLEASPLNPRESIVRAALTHATPQGVAILCAIFLGLAAIMYRNILVAMWPGLVGRKWVTFAVATFCVFLLVGAVFGGLWIYHNPVARRFVPALVPWIVGYLLIEKLAGAMGVGFALKRWNIFSTNQLAIVYASWLLLAGLILGLICCFTSPTWMIAAGVVLALPLSRVAIFPLALHWNRHR